MVKWYTREKNRPCDAGRFFSFPAANVWNGQLQAETPTNRRISLVQVYAPGNPRIRTGLFRIRHFPSIFSSLQCLRRLSGHDAHGSPVISWIPKSVNSEQFCAGNVCNWAAVGR